MKLIIHACRCGHARSQHAMQSVYLRNKCTAPGCRCRDFHNPSPKKIAQIMAKRLLSPQASRREKRVILRHVIDVLAKDFRGKAKPVHLPRE